MGSYYDFSEMLRELEALNGSADDIYALLQKMYTRDGELLTEVREAREEWQQQYTDLISLHNHGISLISALIVAAAAIKVIFK